MPDEKKKAPKKTATKAPAKAAAAAAPVPEGERCSVEGCKQPARAKDLCRKHYMGWRRGKVGKKHRYNTCSKEGCRKKAVFAGCCEEHRKGGAAQAAAA